MSKQKRKPTPTKIVPPARSTDQELERLLKTGRFKDAIKLAQADYGRNPRPETRRLLERAYLSRVQQLQRESMTESAAEVARQFLALGVTDSSLVGELLSILPVIGLSAEAFALGEQSDSPETKARVKSALADHAVFSLDRAPSTLPEIREGAVLVRSAFGALDADDEAGALERLRDIPRSSPFADWRYFVRGLAASRRGDPEQVAANWDRLEAGRKAFRVAKVLQAESAAPSQAPGTAFERLEIAVLGGSVSAALRLFQGFLSEDRFAEIIALLTAVNPLLRKIDSGLPQRLTRVMLWPAMQFALQLTWAHTQNFLDDFTRAAEPLAIDPHWNRFRALVAEHRADDDDEHARKDEAEAEKRWRAYIKEVDTIPAFTPEQRPIAKAAIWRHMAERYLCDAAPSLGILSATVLQPPSIKPSDVKKAVEFLEESIKLAPKLLESYRGLVVAHNSCGKSDRAIDAAKRLLEVAPDDVEALTWIAEELRNRDMPEEAVSYIVRARALKPLDAQLRLLESAARVSLARHYAQSRKFDEGRAELARFEQLEPGETTSPVFVAIKAVFEFKAGQVQRAEEWIEAARTHSVEDAVLWLQLLLAGERFKLARSTLDRFRREWQAALAQKATSHTLGSVARLLASHLKSPSQTRASEQCAAEFYRYVKGSSRIKYQREDLVAVCDFLANQPAKDDLLPKLVKSGLKTFPDSVNLRFYATVTELVKGPFKANLREVRANITRALELAQVSKDPVETLLLPQLKVIAPMVESMCQALEFPSFADAFGFDDGFEDDLDEMPFGLPWFDDEDEEDAFFRVEPEAFKPKTSHAKKRAPKKGKKKG